MTDTDKQPDSTEAESADTSDTADTSTENTSESESGLAGLEEEFKKWKEKMGFDEDALKLKKDHQSKVFESFYAHASPEAAKAAAIATVHQAIDFTFLQLAQYVFFMTDDGKAEQEEALRLLGEARDKTKAAQRFDAEQGKIASLDFYMRLCTTDAETPFAGK